MRYDFDQKIAKDFGVEEAIMYCNIVWWCHKNATERSDRHFQKGHYWTWNSESAWSELFGFWTIKQVSRILANLEKGGLLTTGTFNRKGYDRTKWYRPVTPEYSELEAKSPNEPIDTPKWSNPSDQTGAPIPDNKTQIENTETQKPSVASRRLPSKVEKIENPEDIPTYSEQSDNTRTLIKTLYSLGWKYPKSKEMSEFLTSVKGSMYVAGILYGTSQGTTGINQKLFDAELGAFRAYYEQKPTQNPLSAFIGWMNRRGQKK
jgi:hypothetical protein